jgi:hypothetical protein
MKKRAAKTMKHPQDSHRYLDPYEVWKRVMRVEIPKAPWEEIQRSHFTYWYMPLAKD